MLGLWCSWLWVLCGGFVFLFGCFSFVLASGVGVWGFGSGVWCLCSVGVWVCGCFGVSFAIWWFFVVWLVVFVVVGFCVVVFSVLILVWWVLGVLSICVVV